MHTCVAPGICSMFSLEPAGEKINGKNAFFPTIFTEMKYVSVRFILYLVVKSGRDVAENHRVTSRKALFLGQRYPPVAPLHSI